MAPAPYALRRCYGAGAIRSARRGYCRGRGNTPLLFGALPRLRRGNAPNPQDSRNIRQSGEKSAMRRFCPISHLPIIDRKKRFAPMRQRKIAFCKQIVIFLIAVQDDGIGNERFGGNGQIESDGNVFWSNAPRIP